MPATQQTVTDNANRIRDRIAAAAEKSGRATQDVQLVAVTKYVDSETVKLLVKAGVHVFGESRPQVLWKKAADLDGEDVHWHLIGHLQRNKVKRTLPLVELIHSVDSQRLLDEIENSSRDQKLTTAVLLEVNISGDAAKNGLQLNQVEPLIDHSLSLDHVSIHGLMAMSGLHSNEADVRGEFSALRKLRDELAEKFVSRQVDLKHLSMGMSGDFEIAIEEGATLIRVGSLLFEGLL